MKRHQAKINQVKGLTGISYWRIAFYTGGRYESSNYKWTWKEAIEVADWWTNND